VKLLVTGAAGYLGSTLVPVLLRAGHAVTAIDSLTKPGFLLHVAAEPGFAFHRVDVTDTAQVRPLLSGVDAVVHLAAIVDEQECAADEARAYRVNTWATQQLVALSREAAVRRFLFVSTASIYGASSHDAPAREGDPANARTIYAKSKLQAEAAVVGAAAASFVPMVFRFASLMGVSPIVRYDGVMNRFLLHAARDGTIPVRGGTSWRPCLHVRDAARAARAWLELDRPGPAGTLLNVGEGNYQKRHLAQVAAGAFPSVKIQIDDVAGDRDYCVDFTKSRQLLGGYAEAGPDVAAAELSRAFLGGLLQPEPDASAP